MIAQYTRDGQTWAIPAWADLGVLFYNKDLFDQYRVSYPELGWTWDDFLEATLALRHPRAEVFGYASYAVHTDVAMLIYQHGGRLYDDWQHPTRTTFDDPLAIEALDWYVRLIHTYNVAPTEEQALEAFGGLKEYTAALGIRLGKVAMWHGAFADQGRLRWDVGWQWDFGWGMVPLPRDAQSVTWVDTVAHYVFDQTPHREACWKWVAFLSEQTPPTMVPTRRSIVESEAYEERVGAEVATAVRASLEGTLLPFDARAEWTEEAWEILVKAMDQAIKGEVAAEGAMTWAQYEAADLVPQ